MAKPFSILLLFTAVALTTTATNLRRFSAAPSRPPAPSPATLPISPPPPPATSPSTPPISPPPPTVSTLSPPPSSLPSPAYYVQQQQLKNIIDALIGAGDFAGWANIIFNPNTNSSIPTATAGAGAIIPTTATLFVPGDNALTRLRTTTTGAVGFDPFIIPYHILPQRFTFSELRLLKTQTRLPTLLTSKTIVITNNTPSNFTIDDSLITQPDIYTTSGVCVHGIAAVLDYTLYGEAGPIAVPPAAIPPPAIPPPAIPPPDANVSFSPEVERNYTSVSLGLGVDFLILLFLISSCFVSTWNW